MPERPRVPRESAFVHHAHRPEPTNVAVVKRTLVLEHELDGRVATLVFRELSGVDEQRSREPWLDDDSILRREIENDQLRATPRVVNDCADDAAAELARIDLAEHVAPFDPNVDDPDACDRAVEVARIVSVSGNSGTTRRLAPPDVGAILLALELDRRREVGAGALRLREARCDAGHRQHASA